MSFLFSDVSSPLDGHADSSISLYWQRLVLIRFYAYKFFNANVQSWSNLFKELS